MKNAFYKLLSIVLLIFYGAGFSYGASLVVALNVEDDKNQIPFILENTALEGYKYPYNRHITVMWLDHMNPTAHQEVKMVLDNIVKEFVKTKNSEFKEKGEWRFVSDKVGRFDAGGLYLVPTDTSKKILSELYAQLLAKVTELGLEDNINWHLQTFTPHVTLAEASAANKKLLNKSHIKSFFEQTGENFSNITYPPAKRVSLKIVGASSWFH